MSNTLLATFYVLFAVFAWRRLHWAVLLVIATLPSYLIRFHLGPVPMTVLEGMVLIVVGVWLVKKFSIFNFKFSRNDSLSNGNSLEIGNWKLKIALLFFLLAATIVMFIAPDLRAAAGIWKAYFIEPILFFLVVNDLLRKHATRYLPCRQAGTLHATQIIFAISLTALLLSIYAIFQRFTGFGIPSPWDKELRVTSIFPYPNALGLFLAPLVPLFLAQLFTAIREKRKLHTTYYILLTTVSAMAIVFAHSTGALVGLAAGLFIVGILWLRQKPCGRTKSAAVALGVLATLVALLLVFSHQARNELLLRDWSGHVRRTQWAETVAMLKDRPILGAGLAAYKETLAPYHKATYLEIFEYPHNIVLNFWSETGLLGVISFVWLIIIFFRRAFKSLEIGNWKLEIPAMASMTVILVHGLVDVPYFKNDLAMLFWIIFALGTVNTRTEPKEIYVDPRHAKHAFDLPFWRDNKKLWALDVPVEEMDIQELAWILDVPFWEDAEGNIVIVPNDVLRNPDKYPGHRDKLKNCDTAYPLDIMKNKQDKWLTLDGLHRLAKLIMEGKKVVRVRKIPPEIVHLTARDE